MVRLGPGLQRRGLPHLRNTPDALEQLISESSRTLFSTLGILSTEELESRFHVRIERYVNDMLIEMNTMRQLVDTIVLPAAMEYHGSLAGHGGAAGGSSQQRGSAHRAAPGTAH